MLDDVDVDGKTLKKRLKYLDEKIKPKRDALTSSELVNEIGPRNSFGSNSSAEDDPEWQSMRTLGEERMVESACEILRGTSEREASCLFAHAGRIGLLKKKSVLGAFENAMRANIKPVVSRLLFPVV